MGRRSTIAETRPRTDNDKAVQMGMEMEETQRECSTLRSREEVGASMRAKDRGRGRKRESVRARKGKGVGPTR